MSIIKRLRFEILKRDGFRCAYCGRGAAVAVLHVDHRTPMALAGTDHPSNLVTACEDCNAGKADIPLDDATMGKYERPVLVRQSKRYELEDYESFPLPRGAFTKYAAAFDLLYLSATNRPRTTGALAVRWHWSRNKVRSFLRDVENNPAYVVTYE